jgi:methylmalonyl-CoA mutase N-terminal domain/subunit
MTRREVLTGDRVTQPNDVEDLKADWDSHVLQPVLERFGERQDCFETTSGIAVQRIYTPLDVADMDYVGDVGLPGLYPYTRGIYPTMYRGRLWTMRQYAGYATAEASNRRYHYLLERGQTGLSVAFDLPTQIGYDSDHPMAQAEVGKVGVAIDSLADMRILFAGIPLDGVSTSMTINATAPILLALYVAVAREQGVAPGALRGTVQNDILKEYLARGTYIYPPGPSMRLVTDVFAFCKDHLPRWNTISISGYHIREAGATAVQEVAFTLANAIAYVEAALDAGLDVDDFAPQLSFFFVAQNNVLEEVAKFRAARRLWARIMRERFGAEDEKSLLLRFHTQTAGVSLTAQQPKNNIVRVAMQALAAVLGGTQSLHTNSYDEALGLPTEEAVEIALRTQQIIAHESGVAESVDPLAGSYYVERMTDEIETQAQAYIERIDELGGARQAIEIGYMQREIQEAAYKLQQEVETRERIVVGVNRYRDEQPSSAQVLRIDPQVVEQQLRRLAEVRKRRDQARVDDALTALSNAANGEANVMPHILEAVEAYATLGEIADTMREVFGEYEPAAVV